MARRDRIEILFKIILRSNNSNNFVLINMLKLSCICCINLFLNPQLKKGIVCPRRKRQIFHVFVLCMRLRQRWSFFSLSFIYFFFSFQVRIGLFRAMYRCVTQILLSNRKFLCVRYDDCQNVSSYICEPLTPLPPKTFVFPFQDHYC